VPETEFRPAALAFGTYGYRFNAANWVSGTHTLAHQALQAEPDLGVLLPCNVIVYTRDGQTHISAIDAERMLSIVGNDELAPMAANVRGKLARVVERAAGA
jgi:uncharacterized protein (DUF302 family)